jgi:hypothetical protein
MRLMRRIDCEIAEAACVCQLWDHLNSAQINSVHGGFQINSEARTASDQHSASFGAFAACFGGFGQQSLPQIQFRHWFEGRVEERKRS